jgi:myo-inositol-1(or 4)-monophosphatase
MAERSLKKVLTIVETAGYELKSMFQAGVKARKKKDSSLVTDADLLSEKIIMDWIKTDFPHDLIVSEESGIVAARGQPSGWAWIIDPLDGTSNFANGMSYFCISVAYGELNGQAFEAKGAVILAPVEDKLYSAEKGRGAFLGDRPLNSSTVSMLSEAYVGCGLSLDGSDEALVQTYIDLSRAVHGSRRMGAAALDLANVAAGVFDVFFAENLQPWDMAAGSLLIEEAGGTVRNFNDNLRFNPFEPGVVAGNLDLVTSVQETIKRNLLKRGTV